MSIAAVERGIATLDTTAPKDQYRLLLFRKIGSELLAVGEREPFTLPCLEIPRWERVPENLTAAISKRYGIAAICLFAPAVSPTTTGSETLRYEAMRGREANCAAPQGMRWLPMDALSEQSFADREDFAGMTQALRQIREFQSDPTSGPFGRPEWIEELLTWIQREIEPYGLHMTGKLRQLNASPDFSLVRLETNAQAVWFKAVGKPNLREFPISAALSRLFPGFVPTVIATRPPWNGWLTTEFAGSTLDEIPDACAWERTAQTLGALQIASAGKTDQLLEAGCRDLRVTSLLTTVDPFLEVMAQLMEQQHKTPPSALDREVLLTLGSQTKEALSELWDLGVPDTLGHLDFNPGNILCSRDQCVFLDWAEAAVGHPFLTFQYLLEHLTRLCPNSLSRQRNLASSYAGEWEGVASNVAISRSLSLAPLAAVFAHAVSAEAWRDQNRLTNPQTAGYFRSLTRRMKREADALTNRSPQCKVA